VKLHNQNPLVSVVIPTYNREFFLRRAVQSVLDQTFTDWELLVVDNESTDGTAKYLKTLNDSRIRVLNVKNNGIISISKNLGICQSKGKWVAFLDSDDWWHHSKLFECKKYMMDSIALIYHDCKVDSKYIKRKDINSRQLKSPVLFDLLLNGNPIVGSSVVVKKSLLAEVGYMNENANLNTTADFNTWLKIASKTDSFLHIPQKLGCYSFHKNNVSSLAISKPTIESMEDFLYLLDKKQRRRIVSNLTYSQGRLRFINKDFDGCKTDLVKVLRHGGFQNIFKSIWMLVQVWLKSPEILGKVRNSTCLKYFRGKE
jgi:glycosyltransferase involved in cell wall biosynthesis